MAKYSIAIVTEHYNVDIIEKQLLEKGVVNVKVCSLGVDTSSFDEVVYSRPNKRAIILDLCNVHENCGLPKQLRNFKAVKGEAPEKGETVNITSTCNYCKAVYKASSRKAIVKMGKKNKITQYFCPECDEMVDEVRLPLSKVKKLKLIEESNFKTLTHSERRDKLRELITTHTSAKAGFSHFILRRFSATENNDMLDQMFGNYKGKYLWKKIMRMYNDMGDV